MVFLFYGVNAELDRGPRYGMGTYVVGVVTPKPKRYILVIDIKLKLYILFACSCTAARAAEKKKQKKNHTTFLRNFNEIILNGKMPLHDFPLWSHSVSMEASYGNMSVFISNALIYGNESAGKIKRCKCSRGGYTGLWYFINMYNTCMEWNHLSLVFFNQLFR